ncbi:MAG: DUF1573 domain-containing protein [Candidatus Kapabacteria bacterium]|nr:DUF1573 domain-containing protein [Candidatus Kapabacteria bacterium]
MLNRILLIAVVGVFATISASAQAKLEVVGGDTYDWGKVKPPKEGYLEASIQMKNTGDRAVRITEVRPGCGCTKTDPDKYDLKPGEISTMKVKLNISPTQAGSLTKSITLSWADLAGNDALKEFRTSGKTVPSGADTNIRTGYLWLKADVQREIAFNPSMYFAFNDLKVGVEATSKVEMVNNSDADVTLSDWQTEGGVVVNHTGRVVVKAKSKLDIIAKLVPLAKGNYNGGVKFKTTHPDNPDVDLRAYGFVQESTSPVFQNAPAKP